VSIIMIQRYSLFKVTRLLETLTESRTVSLT